MTPGCVGLVVLVDVPLDVGTADRLECGLDVEVAVSEFDTGHRLGVGVSEVSVGDPIGVFVDDLDGSAGRTRPAEVDFEADSRRSRE